MTGSAAEALAQVEMREVPLVITDYLMPVMNGLQIHRAIKERSPGTRVIMITGFGTPTLEREAQMQGIDVYMTKPFSLRQIDRVVRDLLAENHNERAV